MVTRNNNGEHQGASGDVSVESLYKQYRLSRSSVRTESALTESDVPVNTENLNSPEMLYQSYTKTRSSRDESAVDSIMKSLMVNTSLDTNDSANAQKTIVDQPAVGSNAHQPMVDPVAGNTNNVFKLLKRAAVVAVAAAVFGIVLIPRLSGPSLDEYSLQAAVPTKLLNNANQAVAYIQAPATFAFGFTADTDVISQPFKRGVIAADLTLAVNANRNELYLPLVRYLVQIYQGPANSENHVALQAFIDAANNNDQSKDSDLKKALDKALLLEETQANEEDQLSWYLHGHAVESIRIAAEVFLNGGDEDALKESLNHGKGLALRASTNTSDRTESVSVIVPDLLKRLYSIQLGDGDAHVQATQVLNESQNILVLIN